jgi:hypothetical protein
MLRLRLNNGAVGTPDLMPLVVVDGRERAIGSVGPYGLYAWTGYDFALKIRRGDPHNAESALADFICATVFRIIVTHAATSHTVSRTEAACSA